MIPHESWSDECTISFSSEIYCGINESGYEFSLNHIAFFLNERKPCFIYICENVAIFNAPRFQESQFHAEYLTLITNQGEEFSELYHSTKTTDRNKTYLSAYITLSISFTQSGPKYWTRFVYLRIILCTILVYFLHPFTTCNILDYIPYCWHWW